MENLGEADCGKLARKLNVDKDYNADQIRK